MVQILHCHAELEVVMLKLNLTNIHDVIGNALEGLHTLLELIPDGNHAVRKNLV